MPKIKPADITLEHLDREELFWLVRNYCRVSHFMICDARLNGLRRAATREFQAHSERMTIADNLDTKVMEALEFATAAQVISDRARSSRWSAYEIARSAERRARDRARASYERYQALQAEADLMRDHINRLNLWADA